MRRVMIVANRIGLYKGDTGGGSIFRATLLDTLAKRQGFAATPLSIGKAPVDYVDSPRGIVMTPTLSNLRLVWNLVKQQHLVIVSGSWTVLTVWANFVALLHGVTCYSFITMNSLEAVNYNFTGIMWYVSAALYFATDFLNSRIAAGAWTRSAEYQKELAKMYIPVRGVVFLSDQYDVFMKDDTPDAIRQARSFLSAGQPHLPLLLFCGRIIREKRIPLLIAAKPEGMVLAIVGGGKDAHEIAKFHDPAKGVVCHVVRRVEQDELRVFFKAADIHVSASDFETLGNTVHESLLCKTPVLVQNSGGYVSQVVNGVNGYLVDWRDVPSVQASLQKMLLHPVRAAPLARNIVNALTLVQESVDKPASSLKSRAKTALCTCVQVLLYLPLVMVLMAVSWVYMRLIQVPVAQSQPDTELELHAEDAGPSGKLEAAPRALNARKAE